MESTCFPMLWPLRADLAQKGSGAPSQSHILEVETQACGGRPVLGRQLEPSFCLFQHRAAAVCWCREGSCRSLPVSMSLPGPSASARLAPSCQGSGPATAHAGGGGLGTAWGRHLEVQASNPASATNLLRDLGQVDESF